MKITLFLMCLLISKITFSQYNYEIAGELKVEGANMVILQIFKYDQPGLYSKDSVIVRGGKFDFKGEVDLKCYNADINVVTPRGSYIYQFALEEGTNHINLIQQENKTRRLRNISPYLSRSNSIRIKLEEVRNKERDKFADSRSLAASDAMWHASVNFLKSYPNDFYALFSLYRLGLQINNSVKKDSLILKTYQDLHNDLKISKLGVKLRDEKILKLNAYNESGIGKNIISFKLRKVDGTIFNSKDLDGTPYLLVFSATWCAPCQQQIPFLKHIYKTYNKRGLELVYVNLDDNEKKWKEHVVRNQLDWINISDLTLWRNSSLSKRFAVTRIPKTLVVDKSGVIIHNSDQNEKSNEALDHFVNSLLRGYM